MSASPPTSTEAAARAKALDRFVKLLALARDQSELPEGQTALKLAEALAERWSFTPADAAAVGEAVEWGPPPTLTVPLGGPEDNHHREHFRAALLGLLAELAGLPQAMFDPRSWVGKLYGDEARCREVAAVYPGFAEHLAREFQRFWIPRRFKGVVLPNTRRGRANRAAVAMVWWRSALQGLQRSAGIQQGDGDGGFALVVTVVQGEAAEWKPPALEVERFGHRTGFEHLPEELRVELLRLQGIAAKPVAAPLVVRADLELKPNRSRARQRETRKRRGLKGIG